MDGEAIFLGPAEGREFTVGADVVSAKVEQAATGDAFALIEYTAAPGVPGPPLHVHRATSETFFLLGGKVEFGAGGETRRLVSGAVAFVPPGVPHTFVNASNGVAKWVGIFSPGHAMALVEAIGEALPPGG